MAPSYGIFNALRNNDYFNNLLKKVDNLLENKETITVEELKNKTVFGEACKLLDDKNKSIFNQIVSQDGDSQTVNRHELALLATVLDGEFTKLDEETMLEEYLSGRIDSLDEEQDTYDGKISTGENSLINAFSNTNMVMFKTLYQCIKTKTEALNNDVEKRININGKIDDSLQVQGDCWLLNQLNALSKTDFGAKAIKDAIVDNKDGTYTVNFKGDKKSYIVSADEILKAKEELKYSCGDDDVLLMELAFEKLLNDLDFELYLQKDYKIKPFDNEGFVIPVAENISVIITNEEIDANGLDDKTKLLRYAFEKNNKNDSSINGRSMVSSDTQIHGDVLGHLTGEFSTNITNTTDTNLAEKQIVETLKIKANNPDSVAVFFAGMHDIETKDELDTKHLYYIQNVTLDEKGEIKSVDVVNSWDSSMVITKTPEELLQYSKLLGDNVETDYDYYAVSDNNTINEFLEKMVEI